MSNARVIKGDILDPSTRVLLGSIYWIKLLLTTHVPVPVGIWPVASWMSGEPLRTIWSHMYLLVRTPFVPKGLKQERYTLSK